MTYGTPNRCGIESCVREAQVQIKLGQFDVAHVCEFHDAWLKSQMQKAFVEANLPDVNHKQRWQMKQVRLGNCRQCAQPRPPELATHCRKCQDKINAKQRRNG